MTAAMRINKLTKPHSDMMIHRTLWSAAGDFTIPVPGVGVTPANVVLSSSDDDNVVSSPTFNDVLKSVAELLDCDVDACELGREFRIVEVWLIWVKVRLVVIYFVVVVGGAVVVVLVVVVVVVVDVVVVHTNSRNDCLVHRSSLNSDKFPMMLS